METINTVILTILSGAFVGGLIIAIVSLRFKINGMVAETDRSVHSRIDRELMELDSRFIQLSNTLDHSMDMLNRNHDEDFKQVDRDVDELNRKIDSRYDKLFNTLSVELDKNKVNK